jgi:hypothetical protein
LTIWSERWIVTARSALSITRSMTARYLNEALHRIQNERLALLGDKVVVLILIDSWYETGGSCCTYLVSCLSKVTTHTYKSMGHISGETVVNLLKHAVGRA